MDSGGCKPRLVKCDRTSGLGSPVVEPDISVRSAVASVMPSDNNSLERLLS